MVDAFEKAVAEAGGAEAAVATASGTAALHVALAAAGVGHGDLVILPTYTFIGSANAIYQCGATPWLFDVSADSWTLDPGLMAEHLAAGTERTAGGLRHKDSGRRVAAVLPVYALGHPSDMDPILDIAGRYGLPVVADGAAALGARYRGRPLGSIGALYTTLSFNGNKTFTCGGGGAVLGGREDLKPVRHLSSTARSGVAYLHDQPAFNYRLTALQAAVGRAQLESFSEFLASKRATDEAYRSAVAGCQDMLPLPRCTWADSACWMSGVWLTGRLSGASEQVRATLTARAIETRPFWVPMHLQPPYRTAPRTAMPVADAMWEDVVVLPCSTGITSEERSRVIAVLREILDTCHGVPP
jgi:dTDP-4-amino-4,6-dideoxygalactose transaminase